MIDIYAYAVMSNHYHLNLNNRPDLVKTLTTKEIATRWLFLHPTVSMKDEKNLTEPQRRREKNNIGYKKNLCISVMLTTREKYIFKFIYVHETDNFNLNTLFEPN